MWHKLRMQQSGNTINKCPEIVMLFEPRTTRMRVTIYRITHKFQTSTQARSLLVQASSKHARNSFRSEFTGWELHKLLQQFNAHTFQADDANKCQYIVKTAETWLSIMKSYRLKGVNIQKLIYAISRFSSQLVYNLWTAIQHFLNNFEVTRSQ